MPFIQGPGVQNVGCAGNYSHDWLDSWPTLVLNMHLSAPAHHNREIWFLVMTEYWRWGLTCIRMCDVMIR